MKAPSSVRSCTRAAMKAATSGACACSPASLSIIDSLLRPSITACVAGNSSCTRTRRPLSKPKVRAGSGWIR